jgi:hypothetical protein
MLMRIIIANLIILLLKVNNSNETKNSIQNNLEMKKRILNIYESLNRLPINDNQIKQLNSFSERMLKQHKAKTEESTQQLVQCQENLAQYTRMLVTGSSNKRSLRNNETDRFASENRKSLDLKQFASLNAKSSSKFLHRELDFYLFVYFYLVLSSVLITFFFLIIFLSLIFV